MESGSIGVVLASSGWTGEDDVARTMHAGSHDTLSGRLRQIPVFDGTSIESLPDGSVRVVLRPGPPREVAERAVRCARILAELVDGPVAIAVGDPETALESASRALREGDGALRLDEPTRALVDVQDFGVRLRRGDAIAHFVIEGLLGRGGMGQVYRAHDTRLERFVALKLIGGAGTTLPSSAEGTARVWREARAAAAFNHPNAVSVYEIGETHGHVWIAMEIVDGAPMRRHVVDRSIPWETRLEWMLDAARALGAAHAAGLVHRDVKPENLMVRADGVVKVLDFGIARKTGDRGAALAATMPISLASIPALSSSLDATLTAEGIVVGTPFYIAPEQALSGEAIDGRADQFAWGVTAYELFSGQLPWGSDLGRAMRSVVDGEPPRPLRELAPEVPLPIAAAIERTLRRAPADRFPSMEALIEACVVPAEAMAPVAPTAPVRRSRGVVWLLVGITALGVALGVSQIGKSPTTGAAPSASVAPPISTIPEAAATFTAGMQAWRDGAQVRAMNAMEAAEKLDPHLAAAPLREALWDELARPLIVGSLDPTSPRAAFHRAEAQQATASPYERAFLLAVEPRLRTTPDPAESERRLLEMTTRFPDRGEPWLWIAVARTERAETVTSLEAVDRAIAVEPGLAIPALLLRSWVERGTPEAALATLDRCIQRSAGAADCFGARARLHGIAGRCAAMESDARAWLAADRESPLAMFTLAEALISTGAPAAAARELTIAAEDRMDVAVRPNVKRHGKNVAALLAGDFDASLAQGRAFDAELEINAPLVWKYLASLQIVEAARESGRDAIAGAAAKSFLDRAAAWTPSTPGEIAMPVAMAAIGLITKALTKEAFDRERARWLARAEAVVPVDDTLRRRQLWQQAWAGTAQTKELAQEAVAALAHFPAPLAPDVSTPTNAASVGHVFAKAGDLERAVPYLKRAVAGCYPMNGFTYLMRARLELGDALVALGHPDEARPHYQAIIDRWGDAKPRSVTADAARAALKKLGR